MDSLSACRDLSAEERAGEGAWPLRDWLPLKSSATREGIIWLSWDVAPSDNGEGSPMTGAVSEMPSGLSLAQAGCVVGAQCAVRLLRPSDGGTGPIEE